MNIDARADHCGLRMGQHDVQRPDSAARLGAIIVSADLRQGTEPQRGVAYAQLRFGIALYRVAAHDGLESRGGRCDIGGANMHGAQCDFAHLTTHRAAMRLGHSAPVHAASAISTAREYSRAPSAV